MAARPDDLEVARRVAGIVAHRAEAGFVSLLVAADTEFVRPDFERALTAHLRTNPGLVEAWVTWSADQRWTPSAYIEGTDVGWYDAGRHHVRHHPDGAAAAADLIHRSAAWLARKEIIGAADTGPLAVD